MKSHWSDMKIIETAEPESLKHPEVAALFARLGELNPQAMAAALCHLEALKTFPLSFGSRHPAMHKGPYLTGFSREMKREMEKIYLELARHLQARSCGSQDLMNAIFEFLDQTLSSLLSVPHLISMN
jgi:hypothetical protein